MNEKEEMKNFEENETEELDVENLTEVKGGVEEVFRKGECGLGCFIGTGY